MAISRLASIFGLGGNRSTFRTKLCRCRHDAPDGRATLQNGRLIAKVYRMQESLREPSLSALLLGRYPEDRLLVYDIFRRFGWHLFEARSRRRAIKCLERNPVHVVLVESDLAVWSWKGLLRHLRRLAPSPQLIVASRTADESLWAEVLNIGGYDVLAQPFRRDEVERVIAAARRHFEMPQHAVA
jgi:response regulator RpfG family c-di-GMP phosphodiesterase